MNNLAKYAAKVEKLGRFALGYERMLDFQAGYIHALYQEGKISLKEKKSLDKVYSTEENGNERYQIIDGKLVDNSKDPEWQNIFGND